MMFLVASFGLLLLSKFSTGETEDFSYTGNRGPAHWGEKYETCIGKHQSPINIDEHYVKDVSLPPLILIGNGKPCSLLVINTGHTVKLKCNESRLAMVSGGPLGNNIYVFEQLHFHWGENDHEGSENLINNQSFPLEMHAVFYKENYESMDKALEHDDGLTVLAYLYEISPNPNPIYEPIVEALVDIENVSSTKIRQPFLLPHLLVPDVTTMQDYFTYNGSLTTPPCLEIVLWIDFKDHQHLSREQVAVFRNLRTSEGDKLTHNFRPVQPLEDRIILQNVPNEHSGQRDKMPFSIVALGVLLGIFLFAI